MKKLIIICGKTSNIEEELQEARVLLCDYLTVVLSFKQSPLWNHGTIHSHHRPIDAIDEPGSDVTVRLSYKN